MKNKIIEYFKSKPKISLVNVIILLLFLKYVLPPFVYFLIPLNMGAVSPDVPYEEVNILFDTLAKNLADNFSEIMKGMYLAGQNLSHIGWLLPILFSGIIWSTVVASFALIIYVIRIVIYWILKSKQNQNTSKGED